MLLHKSFYINMRNSRRKEHKFIYISHLHVSLVFLVVFYSKNFIVEFCNSVPDFNMNPFIS